MTKQEFIDNYVDKRMKNVKLPYGLQWIMIYSSVEEYAQEEWLKYQKKQTKKFIK